MSQPDILLPINMCKMREPIYDLKKMYLENAEQGPFFSDHFFSQQEPEKQNRPIDFLGHQINFPIGIPAGPLLNSRWIRLASQLAFDVVCYKTIRSCEYPGHSLPNVIYLQHEKQMNPLHLPKVIYERETPPDHMEQITITNSFGMPSRSPEYLKKDIPLGNAALKKGQVMIVSIVGTATKNSQFSDFATDFSKTASFAKECGAKIIEANFSCPNVASAEGSLYQDPTAVFNIASMIVRSIGDIPLIIKLGVFSERQALASTLVAATRAGVRGICGLNSISMKVMKQDGSAALGSERTTSGVCGNAIREAALHFIREARLINDKEKLGLTILGCGGLTLPEHFAEFLNAGADIAMTATGMMWDPYLALKIRSSFHAT